MNACRVAISTTSNMKKATATTKVSGPSAASAEQDDEPAAHEQDQQVAGEDVGEQSDGERDQPHELRDHLDQEDARVAEATGPRRRPGGQPALEVADRPLGPDPLVVVGDPHHQGQDQRDRDVGGRGVEREARDVRAEDVDLVLGVRRQRDVADHVREPDEQEQRGDEREPRARHRRVHVARGDVVAHQLCRRLRPLSAHGSARCVMRRATQVIVTTSASRPGSGRGRPC